jgi:ABC-type microcin C transport system duplicated ATPase subunit YejF
VQAVVLQLLDRLRRENDIALLFVSHDLNVVRMLCDRTIVLRNGGIVEQGESQALICQPEDRVHAQAGRRDPPYRDRAGAHWQRLKFAC